MDIINYLIYDGADKQNKALVPLPTKIFATLAQLFIADHLCFILPKTTFDLVTWRQKLNICVGAYQNKVVSKESYILGIESQGELIYCIEINSKSEIWQFVGKFNSTPKKEDYELVCQALKPILL